MSPSRPLAVLFLFALADTGYCQRRPERVAWQLVDFLVIGDSSRGVTLIVSPNLRSVQGREGATDVTITLDPRRARRWIAGAVQFVDSIGRLSRNQREGFESTPLAGNLGKTFFTIGMERHAGGSEPFHVTVAPANRDNPGWQVRASLEGLRQLLTAVDTLGLASSLDTTLRQDGTYLTCQLEVTPHQLRTGRLFYPSQAQAVGAEGRVLAEYVIDSTGEVDPQSFRVLLSDGPDFASSAQAAITGGAYTAGRREGQPVRTLVWQWVRFTMPH